VTDATASLPSPRCRPSPPYVTLLVLTWTDCTPGSLANAVTSACCRLPIRTTGCRPPPPGRRGRASLEFWHGYPRIVGRLGHRLTHRWPMLVCAGTLEEGQAVFRRQADRTHAGDNPFTPVSGVRRSPLKDPSASKVPPKFRARSLRTESSTGHEAYRSLAIALPPGAIPGNAIIGGHR